MAPHSSTLALKIPWTEEPGRLQPMGSRRVRHDWETSLSFFTFLHWKRKWQPTPAFLPGESQGRGNLVGCHLWGRTESDTTECYLAVAALVKEHSSTPVMNLNALINIVCNINMYIYLKRCHFFRALTENLNGRYTDFPFTPLPSHIHT